MTDAARAQRTRWARVGSRQAHTTPQKGSPMTRADGTNVRRDVSYVRQQKGHSLVLNLLLIGPLTLFVTTIYYTVSPNHYWHA